MSSRSAAVRFFGRPIAAVARAARSRACGHRSLAAVAPLAIATIAIVSAGCGDELPLAERIASTRPLAARIEILEPTKPPEDPTRAEGLPLETLRVSAFIVDTEAPLTVEEIESGVEPIWLACNMQPLTGLFGCISSRFPLELDDIQDCEATDLSALDPMAMEFPLPPNPCRIVDGTPAEPEMQIPLDLGFLLGGDLEITMIGHQPGSGDTEACARALVTQAEALPSECIVSTMRAPIGPDAELTLLAEMFGLDESFDLGPVPDPVPDPDDNPRIATFSIAIVDENDNVTLASDVQSGDTVTAKVGDRIEIVTEASEDDLQAYVIPRDAEFDDKTELYTGTWFRTWGELLSASSDDPRSMNTWTMIKGPQDEGELPPNGRATLYYVLRDDRQGVDWLWFHVDVES